MPGSLHSPPSDSSLEEGLLQCLISRIETAQVILTTWLIQNLPETIESALRSVVFSVAEQLSYSDGWINDDMAIFVTKKTRQALFEQGIGIKQGITFFKGENLEVLADPIEWALERKLRRIHAANRGRKVEIDIADAIAFLKLLEERNNGPLDLEMIRKMNMNGFGLIPDHKTMQQVAGAYRHKYKEEIFK
ncbi:hypothetical protein VN97_g1514 [Penicillium thymicola]|uniref:Uncharacterized protein n=1 Tax=Penicillium thymicola TaxID=293382 RepID=A0AAI9TQS8_PENTH|nr:hypothetical protein VN97_g1514 [Penicillium thymicola]